MGRSKADLTFGSETLLQRVVRILLEVVDHVVVVHAAEQVLPELDPRVSTVADPIPFGGPLIGLQTGLESIRARDGNMVAAYLTSCDAPFLSPDFVREVLRQLDGHDVAVPFDERYFFPLAAAYRLSLLPTVSSMVRQGERRPRALFDQCNTRRIETQSLTRVDPKLQSLVNLNTPEDYQAVLTEHGLPLPNWLPQP